MVFTPGEVRKCESFDIINDDILESEEEDFTVTIEEVSPSSVVRGSTQTTVTILDDDGTCICLRVSMCFATSSQQTSLLHGYIRTGI